jgi:hypothetical protein
VAVLSPDFGNVRGKGAAARAIGYPLLAFAVPIVWIVYWREREIAEYFAFLKTSPERLGAYTDTLSDLALGSLGSLLAAFVVRAIWRHGGLLTAAPQLDRLGQRGVLETSG